jgi:hypothetical protein
MIQTREDLVVEDHHEPRQPHPGPLGRFSQSLAGNSEEAGLFIFVYARGMVSIV